MWELSSEKRDAEHGSEHWGARARGEPQPGPRSPTALTSEQAFTGWGPRESVSDLGSAPTSTGEALLRPLLLHASSLRSGRAEPGGTPALPSTQRML